MAKKKIPYSERSDIEKIESNWNKVCVLLDRKEWSSAITRAAIASEIAANLAVREELKCLDSKFVDSLLKWANGIQGKFDRLLLPVSKGSKHHTLKSINNKISDINKERNSIVHSGQFKKGSTAKKVTRDAKDVIETLVNIYHKNFKLKEFDLS